MIERTRAGMKAAKARGTHVRRPVRLGGSRLAEARKTIVAGRPVREVAHLFGVDPSTVYRAVAEIGLDKLGDEIAAADAPILDALGRS
jgi:DNA invertase Pin-like site-specific DNA recombinase